MSERFLISLTFLITSFLAFKRWLEYKENSQPSERDSFGVSQVETSEKLDSRRIGEEALIPNIQMGFVRNGFKNE